MKKTITLALTGTFGSGKSSVLSSFRKLGAEAVDCDQIARELTSGKDHRLTLLLAKKFGVEILSPGGGINRKELARQVFSDSKKRKQLESILHPMILDRVASALKASRKAIRVVEIPLLFESKHEKDYDAVIVVKASPSAIQKRLTERGWSPKEIKRRQASQIPLKLKCEKADFILDNSDSPLKAYQQAKIIYNACQNIVRAAK